MDGFNKTIWLIWFQGWDNAPEIAERCLDSWRYYNPEWTIVLLDDTNYKDYCKIDEVARLVQTVEPFLFNDSAEKLIGDLNKDQS